MKIFPALLALSILACSEHQNIIKSLRHESWILNEFEIKRPTSCSFSFDEDGNDLSKSNDSMILSELLSLHDEEYTQTELRFTDRDYRIIKDGQIRQIGKIQISKREIVLIHGSETLSFAVVRKSATNLRLNNLTKFAFGSDITLEFIKQ